MSRQLWFTTKLFDVKKEEEVNPGRFGKGLADWFRGKLSRFELTPDLDPIDEDWGWVVIARQKPCRIWIGCGNEKGSTTRWSLFVNADRGILPRLLKKKEIDSAVLELEKIVETIVKSETNFTDLKWEGE